MDAAEQCSAYQRPIANDRVAQTVKGGENLFWIVRLGTPRESGAHPVGMCDKDPENVSLVAAQIYLLLLTWVEVFWASLRLQRMSPFFSRILKWHGRGPRSCKLLRLGGESSVHSGPAD